MLDVSDAIRAEIGDEEAARLLAEEAAPGRYDGTSRRTPGDTEQERTSTVLLSSDEVRAEIGDEEAARLLAGESAPGSYDCTSCRTPGDPEQERTSTVLFIGDETAVLAFAHSTCLPSQVVQVTEEQLQGAVRAIGGAAEPEPAKVTPEQAVLGVTSGLVLIADELHPALVVEPTAPVARPGSLGAGDDFLPLLIEQGF